MAHPSRKAYIPYLEEKLGPVPISWDEKNSIWDTARRAWLLFDPFADYHVVVQDDTIIGKNFVETCQLIMTKDMVYNFYIGRPKFVAMIERRKALGKDHLIKKNICHEICLGFPTKRVKEMVAYVDSLNPDSDRYINKYVTSRGLRVWFPLPSRVDHRNEGTLHNLNRGHYVAKATWFVGE